MVRGKYFSPLILFFNPLALKMPNIREDRRRMRMGVISDIMDKVTEKGRTLDYEKFLNEMMMKFMVSRRVMREDIKALIFHKGLVVDGNAIQPSKAVGKPRPLAK